MDISRLMLKRIAMAGVVTLALAGLVDVLLHAAWAQNPFGAPKGAVAEPQVGGIIGWLLAKQSEFYLQISKTIRAAKTDGSAVWALLGISFAYGVFHAAGPGHGKAVISSYLVANEETARRGIVLSFASALMQALMAIAIVGIGAAVLNVTAGQMCGAERVIEIASYGLIAAFGARLVWSKGGGFVRALRSWRGAPSPLVPVMAHAHGHDHAHHDHGHSHDTHERVAHDHDHAHAHDHDHNHPDHVHDEHCGHSHGPEPSALAGPGGWSRGLSAVLTVGIRPCSGAILVLVFALAQGLFWAGVAATLLMGLGTAITVSAIAIIAVSAKGLAGRMAAGRDGGGAILLRGIEFGAAALVLLFGVGLLLGYIAAERVTCF
ncbi:MAG: nickel/cobalt transporter [Planctomycetaceae bacterium TMED241]|uniref:nickel/cobalt transporter n=1 Tax=unclassified Afipia TaxID=2642050 RepID=UPI00046768E8|nr:MULTISPECIES: nickel/cobalt transporter [unclassified Afipia]RPG09045.1 MAG: nickel/cobalt transporter [Planctomycetaceae bacterium TMED241]HAP11539.1 nickel transporter [Afipia sp.]HAQ94387.1 nickel transporter [Afipia sp.]HBR46764.1 nickel transporter [Afipia sp.]HCX16110.1 nickel transporter [Afipia sp.]